MRLLGTLMASACLLATAAAPASADLMTRALGATPLSTTAAARLVRPSGAELRPENFAANHRMPTGAQLKYFRAHSDMPYKSRVTGHFTGTTDEIIQWSARKWGFDPDLFRAAATVESWWKMSTLGDNGDSFGLFQMRRPFHCCLPIMAEDTAFNADYYGGILRSYYDGRQTWLNTVEHNGTYQAGDLWGSVGVWASGRWHEGTSDSYVAMVQQRLGERTWTQPGF